jgi:hypothetical protein
LSTGCGNNAVKGINRLIGSNTNEIEKLMKKTDKPGTHNKPQMPIRQ